tara:strand:- start:73 stop:180 length:108 start_codon:yes stop_codon:yes gene_type:complete
MMVLASEIEFLELVTLRRLPEVFSLVGARGTGGFL